MGSLDPRLREISLGREQRRLVYRCLGWIRRDSGTPSWATALEWAAAHYVSTHPYGDAHGLTMPTPGESLRPFRFRPYPDQVEVIDEALALACEATGLDDEGAALAHVCAVFDSTYIAPVRAGEPVGA